MYICTRGWCFIYIAIELMGALLAVTLFNRVRPEEADEELSLSEQSPWEILGFKHLSYKDGIRQHPTDVRQAFHRLSKRYHPDKQKRGTSEAEMKVESYKCRH